MSGPKLFDLVFGVLAIMLVGFMIFVTGAAFQLKCGCIVYRIEAKR